MEVEVLGVGTDAAGGGPLLLLQERYGQRRCLPIWIGRAEREALAAAATGGVVVARPLTHRLLLDILDALEVRLARVRVTGLVGGQFHAELDLAPTGRGAGSTAPVAVSARPSDAVALALVCRCRVEVHETVLDQAGRPADQLATPTTETPPRPSPIAIEDQVEQLRRALTDAGPEDFDPPPDEDDEDDEDDEGPR